MLTLRNHASSRHVQHRLHRTSCFHRFASHAATRSSVPPCSPPPLSPPHVSTRSNRRCIEPSERTTGHMDDLCGLDPMVGPCIHRPLDARRWPSRHKGGAVYLYYTTATVSSTSFTSCSAVSVGSLVFVHHSAHHTDAHKHVIKVVDCHLTIIPGQGHHQHQSVELAYPQDRISYTMDTHYHTFPFTCQT